MVFHEVNVSESDLKKNLEVPEAPNGNFVKQKKLYPIQNILCIFWNEKKTCPLRKEGGEEDLQLTLSEMVYFPKIKT